jgi:hypothetical protein
MNSSAGIWWNKIFYDQRDVPLIILLFLLLYTGLSSGVTLSLFFKINRSTYTQQRQKVYIYFCCAENIKNSH